jgi:molybdopterin/thiamine biosynthesis adenylyltransferase
LTIVDERLVRWEDLSGGFFYTEADVGKRRVESAMYKIKELNMYVKVDTINYGDVNEAVIKSYNLVFVTEMSIK